MSKRPPVDYSDPKHDVVKGAAGFDMKRDRDALLASLTKIKTVSKASDASVSAPSTPSFPRPKSPSGPGL